MRTINDLPKFSGLSNADTVVAALNRLGLGKWENGGTDKEQMTRGVPGLDHHSFGAVYQQIFEYLSDQDVVESVLEIGIQRGGSLLLWQDLFPTAMVIGIDTTNQILPEIRTRLNNHRLVTIWANAYRRKTVRQVLNLFPKGISLIIDDGPHSFRSQRRFLRLYLSLLKHGGIAIIEDIQNVQDLKKLSDMVPADYTWQAVDRTHINGRWDDLMLIIQRT